MKRFLVLDIGCLECGIPTEVVGLYDTPEAGLEAIDAQGQEYLSATDHHVVLIDLENPETWKTVPMTIHALPRTAGLTPCCGKTVAEIRADDKRADFTTRRERVTCEVETIESEGDRL